jgi:sugar/nucleoside kinase (ribokinase family)
MPGRAERVVDYLAVGHVTADLGPDDHVQLGGAVSYAAATALALDLRTAIVTSAAEGFLSSDDVPGVDRHVVRSEVTTSFRNVYDERGGRTQSAVAVARELSLLDVPSTWRDVGVLHLAPVADEVVSDLIEGVRADFVGLTPQGWLREVEPGREVAPRSWSAPRSWLERVDAVVVSDEDLVAAPEALALLREHVPITVVTEGADGAVCYAGSDPIRQPALPAQPVDPTGAGDTFAAALFVSLWHGRDIGGALRFAAAAAAFAVESVGVAVLPGIDVIEERAAGASPTSSAR